MNGPRGSLKSQITWVMLLLVVASLGLFTLVIEKRLVRDMTALLEAQQFSSASYIAADIDTKVRQRIELLDKNAALLADLIDSPERTREFLKGRIGLQALFQAGLVVVDRNGLGVADYPVVGQRGSASFSDREYVQEAMTTGKTVIGAPRIGPYSKRPVVPIAAPIRARSGEIAGVLIGVATLSDRSLFGNVEQGKVGRSGWILVSSPRHRLILSSSDPARILQPLPPPGTSPMLDRFVAGYQGSGLSLNYKGEESLVSAKAVPSAGWIVHVALPAAEAFAPVRNLAAVVYAIAAGIAVLAGLLVWLLVRHALHPLDHATGVIHAMATGEREMHPLAPAGHGEVQNLLTSFNALLAQRKAVEDALRAAQQFNQATLDGLTDHICVLDAEGTLLAVNRAWRTHAEAGMPLRIGVGGNYLAACDSLADQGEAARLGAGLRAVLAGRTDYFELEYPCLVLGESRWFMARVSRLPVEGSPRVVVANADISALKAAELREHNARDYAENLVRTANVMVVELDREGRVRRLNPVAERITGYTLQEMQGRDWFATLVPRARYPVVWQLFERLAGGDRIDHFENPILTRSGEERHIAWSNSLLRDGERVTGIVSFGMDITEQRAMARRLAEAQRIAHLGTWNLDHASQEMVWSGELAEILECPPGPARRTWQDFLAWVHPDDRQWLANSFGLSLRSQQVFDCECRLLLGDDQVKHAALRAETEYGPDNAPRLTFGTVLDVTDKVIQEEMLRESEERYKTIANYTYDWEYWRGTQNEILYMSPSCERITGYARLDFIGDPDLLRRIVHPDDRHDYEHHLHGIADAKTGDMQFRILTKSGEVRWIAHGCQAVFAQDGRFLGRRASNRDITDLKNAEEAAHRLAYFDSLTELPNRRMLIDRLRHALAHAQRHRRILAVLFLDLDRFKQVNDSLGHDIGDGLLVDVARRLVAVVRSDDTVARMGGDEFVILLPEIASADDAGRIAAKVIETCAHPFEVQGHAIEVTTSVGIALYPGEGAADSQELMKKADIAMYRAKQAGRNCYRMHG